MLFNNPASHPSFNTQAPRRPSRRRPPRGELGSGLGDPPCAAAHAAAARPAAARPASLVARVGCGIGARLPQAPGA